MRGSIAPPMVAKAGTRRIARAARVASLRASSCVAARFLIATGESVRLTRL
jgi:hypothetical protein